MISIVLPYWQRRDATLRALQLMDNHYGGGQLDFEAVLVDDGSHDIEADYPWLTIERLPKKDVAKNPCVPINHGARLAKGDVLVISNPEILHHKPVLYRMRDELRSLGDQGYVMAAAWYEREQRWHCHSSIVVNGERDNYKQPAGSGFHFCSMLYRTLWEKCGGFDEDYRDGSHWDDPDFVNRLNRAGAVFRILDDVVVEHTRDGADSMWPNGAHERNKDIFMRKWPQ